MIFNILKDISDYNKKSPNELFKYLVKERLFLSLKKYEQELNDLKDFYEYKLNDKFDKVVKKVLL